MELANIIIMCGAVTVAIYHGDDAARFIVRAFRRFTGRAR